MKDLKLQTKKNISCFGVKINVLQDYVEELQSVQGRITFEKLIDTLSEAYITQKLGVAKEEHLREEIKDAFDKL
ncbi:MAG: hypothetical protein ACLR2Q_02850 [Finegoldia magna]